MCVQIESACMCILGLGSSMIVIHCCDNWSTIAMMIVLFYYHDNSRHDFIVYKAHFMQMLRLWKHSNPAWRSLEFEVNIISGALKCIAQFQIHCNHWPTCTTFNDIQYYCDSIHCCDMLLCYCDSVNVNYHPALVYVLLSFEWCLIRLLIKWLHTHGE